MSVRWFLLRQDQLVTLEQRQFCSINAVPKQTRRCGSPLPSRVADLLRRVKALVSSASPPCGPYSTDLERTALLDAESVTKLLSDCIAVALWCEDRLPDVPRL